MSQPEPKLLGIVEYGTATYRVVDTGGHFVLERLFKDCMGGDSWQYVQKTSADYDLNNALLLRCLRQAVTRDT